MLKIALTCDDAPWSASLGGNAFREGVMDGIRQQLLRCGVGRCVAFVNSEVAMGQEPQLERWLEAGFELGNHTHDHRTASESRPEHFLDSVERCDRMLQSLGAFDDGRTRWFRFPKLDRGPDAQTRRLLKRGCEDLGYRIAHASTDFFDHHFEARYVSALEVGDEVLATHIARRYRRVATESLSATRIAMRAVHGVEFISVPYFHFGAVSLRTTGAIFDQLTKTDVAWCDLEEAMGHPVFTAFDANFDVGGVVPRPAHMSLPVRVGRRVGRLSHQLGWFRQARLGPRFPYL
ncbi:MAG: polysaccharide deacetylase family protein [Myxococcales bacterium]|nr:polysaccharide deacetylase family protein [Myxococcales bacterium]